MGHHPISCVIRYCLFDFLAVRQILVRSLQIFVCKLDSLRPQVLKISTALQDKEDKDLKEREDGINKDKKEAKDEDEGQREKEREKERYVAGVDVRLLCGECGRASARVCGVPAAAPVSALWDMISLSFFV
jgi:hypothetical protein